MSKKTQDRKLASKIFEQWEASLLERDLRMSSVEENFDDLFFEMDKFGIDKSIVEEFIGRAIASHLPNKKILKRTYRRTGGFGMSIDEFYKGWKDQIARRAKLAFYRYFPLDDEPEQTVPSGMSRDEYKRQRRYASSFPQLDLSKLPDLDEQEELDIDDLEL